MGNCLGGKRSDEIADNVKVEAGGPIATDKPTHFAVATNSVTSTENLMSRPVILPKNTVTSDSTVTSPFTSVISETPYTSEITNEKDKPATVVRPTVAVCDTHSHHKERMARRMGIKLRKFKEPEFKYTKKLI